jgi:membrane-bound lytic murein transglycosylase D
MRKSLRVIVVSLLAPATFAAAERPSSMTQSSPAPRSSRASTADPDELYKLAAQIFEQLPPLVKAQFEFPTKPEWDALVARANRAFEGNSLEDLAALAADARVALTALRNIDGYEDLADWLEQRIDEFEGAQQAARASTPRPAPPSPRPDAPRTEPVPHYDLWLARVRHRPPPERATELLPPVRAAFATEGVPPELVWLAEAESSFNPIARSPAGAKGLFQFTPETARAQGLSTFLPDDRTNPEKSARAAARYLRSLHARFGNWALAFAAYNAGEGRVSRALAARKATTFTAIADVLPAETRMYVPKVCALIATRTGVPPGRLAAPR